MNKVNWTIACSTLLLSGLLSFSANSFAGDMDREIEQARQKVWADEKQLHEDIKHLEQLRHEKREEKREKRLEKRLEKENSRTGSTPGTPPKNGP